MDDVERAASSAEGSPPTAETAPTIRSDRGSRSRARSRSSGSVCRSHRRRPCRPKQQVEQSPGRISHVVPDLHPCTQRLDLRSRRSGEEREKKNENLPSIGGRPRWSGGRRRRSWLAARHRIAGEQGGAGS